MISIDLSQPTPLAGWAIALYLVGAVAIWPWVHPRASSLPALSSLAGPRCPRYIIADLTFMRVFPQPRIF